MKQTLWRRLLLVLICAALLLLLGCGDETGSTVSNAPGASVPNAPGGSDPNAASNTGESVFADQAEAEAALEAELQAALAAKEAKQLWSQNCFAETRDEASVWRCALLDYTELYPELLEALLPNATVKNRTEGEADPESPDGVRGAITLVLSSAGKKLTCSIENAFLSISGLDLEGASELMPKAAEWLAEKTGLEQGMLTGSCSMRVDASEISVGWVDGLPILPKAVGTLGDVQCGLWRARSGSGNSLQFGMPFSVEESAGTVRLRDSFSPEELRMTMEFSFDPRGSVIEVYRSCSLCYLFRQRDSLLIPVWLVKGTRYDLETGGRASFELVVDAETGEIFDLGGV